MLILWMDFKVIWINCSPKCVDVPFASFMQMGLKAKVTQVQEFVLINLLVVSMLLLVCISLFNSHGLMVQFIKEWGSYVA